MQTVIQVLCTGGASLRQRIANDRDRLEEFELKLGPEKKLDRNPGWTKMNGRGNVLGGVNMSWDAATRTLTCRVVNRRLTRPHRIVGRLVDFLLCRYRNRIKVITIFEV
jgi:hypothetical protein